MLLRKQEREVISLANKIYVMVDVDSANVIYASNSRADLEEQMCDMFMEDYQYEMSLGLDNHWIDMENPGYDTHVFANDTWNYLMKYYNDYINIQEAPIL